MAGNFLDGGAAGRMDCIDHATSTTRLLKALQARIQKMSFSARDERRSSAELEREIQSLQQQRVTRISRMASSPSSSARAARSAA